MLLIPASRLAVLGGTVATTIDTGALASLRFQVTGDSLARAGAVTLDIRDGEFAIEPTAGTYVACLAGTDPGDTPGPPYSVVGCAAVEMRDAGGTLVISHGEGGVTATFE